MVQSIVPNADSVDDDVAAADDASLPPKAMVVDIGPVDKTRMTMASFVNAVAADQDCRLHRHRHCSNLRHFQIHLDIHRQPTTDQRATLATTEWANAHLAG